MGPRPDPGDVMESVRGLSLSFERWRRMFAARHGLADNDSIVLSHLAAAGGRLLPRDLSAAMEVRTGTLTAMLDRLEAVGFVRRVPNPDDRRSTFVELTDEGATTLDESFALLRRRVLSGLPAGTHTQFARYLADLAKIIDEALATPPVRR